MVSSVVALKNKRCSRRSLQTDMLLSSVPQLRLTCSSWEARAALVFGQLDLIHPGLLPGGTGLRISEEGLEAAAAGDDGWRLRQTLDRERGSRGREDSKFLGI